ncbi:MAG: hypothetical protein CL398_00210 [Acidiferrobacteraceae bacterium]|nr:hypothetical protein [Acidiferrobacteraceae bacterium]
MLPPGPLANPSGFLGDGSHKWAVGDTVTSIAIATTPEEADPIGTIRRVYSDRALVQWGKEGPFSQERFHDLVWVGPPEQIFTPPSFGFSVPHLELSAEGNRTLFPQEHLPLLEKSINRTSASSFGRSLAHAYPFSTSPPLDARLQPKGLEAIRLFLDKKRDEMKQLEKIGGYDFRAERIDTADVGYAVAATDQPTATYKSVAEKLKEVGLDLQKGRRSPTDWTVVSDQTIGHIRLVQRIPAEAWTGYSKGKGQQTVGDISSAINRLGVEVEIEDLNTGEYGSDRAFEGNQFEKQQELYNDVEAYVRGAVFPTVSYRNIGRTTAGHEWKPGDLVNVSRPGKQGGGLALGHIRRVYPSEVMVEWPADKLHQTPWTTHEDKDELIFVKHDPEWLALRERGINLHPATFRAEASKEGSKLAGGAERPVPGLGHPYSSLTEEGYILEHYIESRMFGPKPAWAQQLQFDNVEPFNPLKEEHDVWTEHDKIMKGIFKELDSNPFTKGHRSKYNLKLDDL